MKTARPPRLVAGLAGVCVLASGVLAQHDATAPPPRPMQPPNQPQAPGQDANRVKYEPLAGRDENGKTKRIDGILDIYSLHRNPTIDEATWQKITPVLVEWMGDMDWAVIDNLDFVEKLDGGMLDRVEIMDMNNNRMIMEMMMQFLSIGPATTTMDTKGALTKFQAQVNTNIGNEYLQRLLDEERQAAQERAKALPEAEREAFVVNGTSRFIFDLMWRDANASYIRQLDEAAPNVDAIIDQLSLSGDTASNAMDAARKVKAAAPGEARRRAMKETLALMPFDKRQEFLKKAREAAPPFNPRTAYVPPPPEVAAPAAGNAGNVGDAAADRTKGGG